MRDQLWVWEAHDERGGLGWYTIGAVFDDAGALPLVMRKEKSARDVEPIARAHGKATGEDVRLAVYQRIRFDA